VGCCIFFLVSLRRLYDDYQGLFGGGAEDDGQGVNLAKKYGWIVVVDSLAMGDVLKWDAIFNLNARQFLNYVQYYSDKKEVEAMKSQ
jgi:hypothetical protein